MILQNRGLRYTLGGFTLVGLSYLAYRWWRNDEKQKKDQHQDKHLKTAHSHYSQFYFDKQEELQVVLSKIPVQGPSVEDVFLLSTSIVVDEYIKYTRQIRKRRRLIRKANEEQYVSLIRNYEFQIVQLLERGRLELLGQCGVSSQSFDKMTSAYEMFQNLQNLKSKSMQKLKEIAASRQPLRRIPLSKLRKIVEQEINFIQSRMYERLRKVLENDDLGFTQQDSHRIITTLIDDIVFEKYGYERQQIERQICQIPSLANDLRKQRQALFADIVQFNMDSMESQEDEHHVEKSAITNFQENDNTLDES